MKIYYTVFAIFFLFNNYICGLAIKSKKIFVEHHCATALTVMAAQAKLLNDITFNAYDIMYEKNKNKRVSRCEYIQSIILKRTKHYSFMYQMFYHPNNVPSNAYKKDLLEKVYQLMDLYQVLERIKFEALGIRNYTINPHHKEFYKTAHSIELLLQYADCMFI